MNVIIRADSSTHVGIGHIQRCLTLADALHERGATISFICCDLPGNTCDLIKDKGYSVYRLSCAESNSVDQLSARNGETSSIDWKADAEQVKAILEKEAEIDWLVVDHYSLDSRWEMQMRPFARQIMVIDDLADRSHDCDLLLDQNLYENFETRYDGLVPKYCKKFLGPKYILLRPEFVKAQENLRGRDGTVKRVMVFFGGGDPTNETMKALEAMGSLNRYDITVDVIIGIANPYKKQIKHLCESMPNIRLFYQVDNIAQLMVEADLAIGAGGTTLWERCFLGLPTIVLIIAQNQAELSTAVAKEGAIWNLGWYYDVDKWHLADAVRESLENPNQLRAMSKAAMQLVGDGWLTHRESLINAMLEEHVARS